METTTPTTTDQDAPLRPGDRVVWTDMGSGEQVRGKISRTPREEPWLAKFGDETIEVHCGEDPSCEDDFDTVTPDNVTPMAWRCVCCDGPDGRGVHHLRGGIPALNRAWANGTLPDDGPILVEDRRGRLIVELADRDAAIEFLSTEGISSW